MAEAPDNTPEENDVNGQAEGDAMDPADLQQNTQTEEATNLQDVEQSKARAASSKKKKRKDKSGSKKTDSEKSAVPMSNVKNLQELISKLSSMPSSLTAALSETDGPSKGHEFWDTQPVPKLGNVTFLHWHDCVLLLIVGFSF